MTDMHKEIEELRALSTPELLERYEALFGRPPRVKHREHLWKRCAWKVQESRFGGISAIARARLEELIAEIDLPAAESRRTVSGVLRKPKKARELEVGTILTRRWHERDITVTAVEDGIEWEGNVYGSLSAVARAATGTRWNGRLFFQLTERRKPS